MHTAKYWHWIYDFAMGNEIDQMGRRYESGFDENVNRKPHVLVRKSWSLYTKNDAKPKWKWTKLNEITLNRACT